MCWNDKKENDIIQCSSKDYYHNCKINKSNKQKKIIIGDITQEIYNDIKNSIRYSEKQIYDCLILLGFDMRNTIKLHLAW